MIKQAGETPAGAVKRHERNTSAHFQPLGVGSRAGEYMTDMPVQGTAGYSPDAGLICAGIFTASVNMRIDRLAINVATPASAGKQARLGIYGCSGSFYPGGLIVDGGVVAVDGSGPRSVNVDVKLAQGYYFLAVMLEESCALTYLKLCRSPLGMYSSFAAVFSGYGVEVGWGLLPEVFPAGGTIANVFRLVGARLAGGEA